MGRAEDNKQSHVTAHPRFTTVIANRMWKKAMGLALIEPLDELIDSSEASNPELNTFLESKMKQYNYDLKKFTAMLHNTKTYQRQAHRKDVLPGEAYHFQGPLLRRMSAEQIWDSFVTLINPDPEMENTIGPKHAAGADYSQYFPLKILSTPRPPSSVR